MPDDDIQPYERPFFLDRLDLDDQADERAIKRAYARELKQIDIEADPVGFQVLREAYDSALSWVRYRDADDADDTESADGFDEIGRAALSMHLPAVPLRPEVAPYSAPPVAAPEHPDPDVVADQALAALLARCATLGDSGDSEPWQRELQASLAGPDMIHVDARKAFEQRIANLLAEGWRPGQHCLFPAAVEVFEWSTDRRRVQSLDAAGYVLHFAVEQRAIYNHQYDYVRDEQRRVIARLRDPAQPSPRELIDMMPTLKTLEAHFAAWLSLITDADNIARWHALDKNLSPFARIIRSKGFQVGIVPFLAMMVALLSITFGGDAPVPSVPAVQTVAEQHVERGDEFLEVDNLKAIDSYSSALAADPANTSAYSGRAFALIYLGRNEEAVADLRKLEAIEPLNAAMFRARGLMAAREDRHADALAAYSRSLELDADSVFALTQRGYAYNALGKPDLARQDADRLLQLHPGYPWAHMLRARIAKKSGDADAAKAEAAPLLAASGNDAKRAYGVAAMILYENGDRAGAVAAMDKVVAISPEAEQYVNRSHMRAHTDFAARRADIEKALELEPGGSTGLIALIRLEVQAKQWNAVVTAVDRAADKPSMQEDRQFMMLNRGVAHTRLGQADKAEADFALARKASTRPMDLNNLCFEMASQNVALPTALSVCEESLMQKPDSYPTLDSKAFTLMRMKRFREALVAYDQALAVYAKGPDALYGRGIAKMRLGDKAGGRVDIQAALALDPGMAAHFARLDMTP